MKKPLVSLLWQILVLVCVLPLAGCDLAKPLNKEQDPPQVVQTIPVQKPVQEESPKTELPKVEPPPIAEEIESKPVIETPQPAKADLEIESSKSDRFIANLFANKRGDVQVQGIGTVTRLLSDDNKGDRHQRFILTLEIGQTLLIAHNIDIAPRLDGIAIGDKVEFFGEYYYDAKGGGIHWTHRDLRRRHVDGWLKWNGKVFQ